MIEDMYTVMDRINEIKKKFGLKRHNPLPGSNNSSKMNYEKIHNDALKRVSDTNKSSNTTIGNINTQKGINVNNRIDNIKGNTVEEINSIVEYYANKNKISPSLVKAIIEVESGYNPKAVSEKGAKGLMQLMPSVIQDMGVINPFIPAENIRGGVELLKDLLKHYNWDYKKALAAYNAGKNVVDREGGIPPYKETHEYVHKVIEHYMKNRE